MHRLGAPRKGETTGSGHHCPCRRRACRVGSAGSRLELGGASPLSFTTRLPARKVCTIADGHTELHHYLRLRNTVIGFVGAELGTEAIDRCVFVGCQTPQFAHKCTARIREEPSACTVMCSWRAQNLPSHRELRFHGVVEGRRQSRGPGVQSLKVFRPNAVETEHEET